MWEVYNYNSSYHQVGRGDDIFTTYHTQHAHTPPVNHQQSHIMHTFYSSTPTSRVYLCNNMYTHPTVFTPIRHQPKQPICTSASAQVYMLVRTCTRTCTLYVQRTQKSSGVDTKYIYLSQHSVTPHSAIFVILALYMKVLYMVYCQ